jgi:hypothetical protein
MDVVSALMAFCAQAADKLEQRIATDKDKGDSRAWFFIRFEWPLATQTAVFY